MALCGASNPSNLLPNNRRPNVHQQTYAPPPVRRRTNPLLIGFIILLGLGLVAVVAVVIIAAAGGGQSAASEPTHPASSTVTDAPFTFHVTKVEAKKRVKGDGGSATAKGTFVLVHLAVTNGASKPRFVGSDDQKLQAGGKTYAFDLNATVEVDKGPEIGAPEQINPGATEEIVVVFDVPAGANPEAVELHGSASSGGVKVALPAI